MKTFRITYSVHDGEHEYWSHQDIEARTQKSAVNKWAKENEFKRDTTWNKEVYQSPGDYRVVEIECIEEIVPCACCKGTGYIVSDRSKS